MIKCEIPDSYFGHRNRQIAYRRGFSDRAAGKPPQRYYKPSTGPAFAYSAGFEEADRQILEESSVSQETP